MDPKVWRVYPYYLMPAFLAHSRATRNSRAICSNSSGFRMRQTASPSSSSQVSEYARIALSKARDR